MKPRTCLILLALALLFPGHAGADEPPARVTILYDAFGKPSALKRGWGYSALVEYGGKRILFDTGGNLDDFAFNVRELGVDLAKLDFVVLSHRHADHTSGLGQVLKINPAVLIHTPVEPGYFDTPAPPALTAMIRRRVDSAPDDMHYFDGRYPEQVLSGSPWPGAKFTQVRTPTEVAPGFWLFSTQSTIPGTLEMNEVSLAIVTPRGLVVVAGCSHPGIETILEAAAKIDARLFSVFGGFHLAGISDTDVTSLVTRLHDRWHLERVAAGHCTGEYAFSELNRVFGAKLDHAGVGAVIPLPR